MKKAKKLIALILLMSLFAISKTPDFTVTATDFNSDVWKNEGRFTPLTPFTSFAWTQQQQSDFAAELADWSIFMDQSYYQIMDAEELRLTGATNPEEHNFRGYRFDEIVKNAYIDGYKIGFTYQNRDYRSDFDSQRFDIFAMYGSNRPEHKHFYIFAVEMQSGQPIILYLDGETMFAGEIFNFKETANEEL